LRGCRIHLSLIPRVARGSVGVAAVVAERGGERVGMSELGQAGRDRGWV
jgi:hypothetical protein